MILDFVAPAKINLGLHVLRRRSDGYHDIETVFIRIPWADHLRVKPSSDLRLTCTDPSLPVDDRNLVMKAAGLLRSRFGVSSGAAIHLEKRVPFGAGLGGGSSDAAAALRALSSLWNLPVAPADLHEMALALGSDVPFFLNGPAAYATGRGERLAPLTDPATGAGYTLPYPLVILAPFVSVSTREAYRMVAPVETDRPDLADLVRSNDLGRWRRHLVNDFERPVLEAFPPIRAARAMLLDAGAAYVSLSGSGSAVFGVFEQEPAAEAAAEAARMSGNRVWHGFV